MIYDVYERTDAETKKVAEIDGETITGEEATMVRDILIESGKWPGTTPDLILHGSRLWAVLQKGG